MVRPARPGRRLCAWRGDMGATRGRPPGPAS